jgi:hypothetical protein
MQEIWSHDDHRESQDDRIAAKPNDEIAGRPMEGGLGKMCEGSNGERDNDRGQIGDQSPT